MSIPPSILEQHIAILGKTGSGKTVCAKVIAEHLLKARSRVCVIDPTSAWWGLRSNSAGTGPGFPVVVFGGEHADVPLAEGHGATLAEIVGTSDLSCVIDTQMMTVGERTRFFTDFAQEIFRKNRGPLHLIIDEAHVFAPQGKIPDPQAGKMLSAANNLVSLGRGRGFRIILISQRPAKLHKDSLSQAETLIAMRLVAPQDRDAVEDWIGASARKSHQGDELLESLPELKTGEGWIWSPQIGLLERRKFPMMTTFDTSRAPDGETAKVVLARVDLPTIHGKLASIVEQAKENDPRRLKARIAELERAAKSAPSVPVVDRAAIIAAEKTGYADGFDKGRKAGADQTFQKILSVVKSCGNSTVAASPPPFKSTAAAELVPTVVPDRITRPVRVVTTANGDLTGPEQRIVDAIAWMESIGIDAPEKTAVAFLAGYTIGGGAFGNPCGALRTRGYIEYSGVGMRLTDSGRSRANRPDAPLDAQEIQKRVLERLPGPERKILSVLIAAYPQTVSVEDCAANAGYAPAGGAFGNPRGRLRTLGLIDYPERGMLKARPLLFLEK